MKAIKIFLFLATISFCLNLLPLYSQEISQELSDDTLLSRETEPEEMELYVDEMKSFPALTPKRVVVGNPKIVDVGDVSESAVMLNPKAPGSTTFIFWDNTGEHGYRLRVMAEKTEEIKARIDALLEALEIPGIFTKISKGEEKVFILGEVKTLDEKERLITVLGDLAAKTVNLIKVEEEKSVVDIDVQVLELSEGAGKTLGLTWPSSITLTEVGSPAIATAGSKWSTLFKVMNLFRGTGTTAAPFSFKLDALIQEGKAQVLSRPRLACQSGKEAELLVGGEKPIFTTSSASATTGTSTSVSYKEYGIKLKIKPQVSKEERLKLSVNVEITELETIESIGTTSGTTTTTTATAYPVTKRSAVTELFLNSGQTLTIGGLIKQKKSETVTSVPFLGKVPILGMFFRKRATTTGGGATEQGDKELFILLTPTIIKQEMSRSTSKSINQLASEPVSQFPPQVDQPSAETNESANWQTSKLADPITEYAESVKKIILENITYSSLARDSGDEGMVTLSLKVSAEGRLLDAIIKKSSGSPALDTNTLLIAKEIFPYPAFPSSIKQNELRLEIPVVYKLD